MVATKTLVATHDATEGETREIMGDEEKEIVRMIVAWVDSLGPGNADLSIGEDATDEDCNGILDIFGGVSF